MYVDKSVIRYLELVVRRSGKMTNINVGALRFECRPAQRNIPASHGGVLATRRRGKGRLVATCCEDQREPDATVDVGVNVGIEALLDGLVGDAQRDRAELITWLLHRGFTVDQITASPTPMMLHANRVMGDHGVYVSTREISRMSGIELELLQQLMRAAGLPRIEDPDAAVVPLVDGQAVAQAKYLLDIGLDSTEAVAVVKVLTEGFGRRSR